MRIAGLDIGVCSWSLEPTDSAHLVTMLAEPWAKPRSTRARPARQPRRQATLARDRPTASCPTSITAGMIAFPGEDYSSIAAIRRTLRVPGPTSRGRCGAASPVRRHASRRPSTRSRSRRTRRLHPAEHVAYGETMLGRVRDVATDFAELGADLLMETGQERAEELRDFMTDLAAPHVFVNFDPANMILYGAGDPIEAIGLLARPDPPRSRQGPARPSANRARRGARSAVRHGAGQAARVAHRALAIEYGGPLVIDRRGRQATCRRRPAPRSAHSSP